MQATTITMTNCLKQDFEAKDQREDSGKLNLTDKTMISHLSRSHRTVNPG